MCGGIVKLALMGRGGVVQDRLAAADFALLTQTGKQRVHDRPHGGIRHRGVERQCQQPRGQGLGARQALSRLAIGRKEMYKVESNPGATGAGLGSRGGRPLS